MVNEDYDPDAVEDAVMAVLRREQRANPYLIREQTDDISKQAINNALRNLCAAGWVTKVTRGLYDYVDDPRAGDGAERADAAHTRRECGVVSRAREALSGWDPEDVDTAKARRATLAVVEWLAAQAEPQQKAAIGDWYDGELAWSTAWQKAIRPGLRELADRKIVAHQRNVGWWVVEKEK